MSLSNLRTPSQGLPDDLDNREHESKGSSSSSSSSDSDTGDDHRPDPADQPRSRRHGRRADQGDLGSKVDKLIDSFDKLSGMVLENRKLIASGRASPDPVGGPGRTPFRPPTGDLPAAVARLRDLGGKTVNAGAPGAAALSFKDILRSKASAFGAMADRPTVPHRASDRLVPDDDSDTSSIGSRRGTDRRRGRRDGRRDDDDPSLDKPLAGDILKMIFANHRSALEFVTRGHSWHNTRAYHEARRQAQVLDAFLRDGAPHTCDGIEMLCRNVAGLWAADELHDPTQLEVMEFAPPQRIIPSSVMRTMQKDAEKLKKLRAGKGGGGGHGAGSVDGAAGRR